MSTLIDQRKAVQKLAEFLLPIVFNPDPLYFGQTEAGDRLIIKGMDVSAELALPPYTNAPYRSVMVTALEEVLSDIKTTSPDWPFMIAQVVVTLNSSADIKLHVFWSVVDLDDFPV